MTRIGIKPIITATIIIGALTPFIDYFVVIEMFFLLIPFAIILVISAIIFLVNCIRYRFKVFEQKSAKFLFILPLFLITQIIATFVVDKIQRFRSEQIICKLEKSTNHYPEHLNISLGVKYKKDSKSNSYEIQYERGFFVREIYNSEKKNWESFGWND